MWTILRSLGLRSVGFNKELKRLATGTVWLVACYSGFKLSSPYILLNVNEEVVLKTSLEFSLVCAHLLMFVLFAFFCDL